MKSKPALSLIELLLVMSLIAILGLTSVVAFGTFRQKQALAASAQELADTISRAHIYSREEKSATAWAVKRINSQKYVLISGSKTNNIQQEMHQTEAPVYILNNSYEIWFNRATGDTNSDIKLNLTTPNGFLKTVEVSENGIIKIN